MITSVFIILLMLLLSAFFSGMEIAFTSKNRLKLEIDRKQSRLFNFIADIFARHPGQYITTILVGNNIALVIYSLYMSLLLRSLAAAVGWTEIARVRRSGNGGFDNHHHLRRRISPEIRFPEQPEFLLPPVCSCDLFLLSAAFSDRQADDLDFPGDFVADGA